MAHTEIYSPEMEQSTLILDQQQRLVFIRTSRIPFLVEEGVDHKLDSLIQSLIGDYLANNKNRLESKNNYRGPHAAIIIGYARQSQTVSVQFYNANRNLLHVINGRSPL
jgi:hypothetical protein